MAASIVVVVVRDRLMREYDKDFSGYGLARHKGYATKIHRDAIKARRDSFTVGVFVKEFIYETIIKG